MRGARGGHEGAWGHEGGQDVKVVALDDLTDESDNSHD